MTSALGDAAAIKKILKGRNCSLSNRYAFSLTYFLNELLTKSNQVLFVADSANYGFILIPLPERLFLVLKKSHQIIILLLHNITLFLSFIP